MTARREFGTAIVLSAAGAGLVLLALRQGWARVHYHAPAPLPSGSVPVTGQNLLPAAGALALAALACLAAVIATRGVARRVAGALMAVLGGWAAVLVSAPVPAATMIAAASGVTASGGLAGSLPGGNSAISGNPASGGGLPVIGTVTRIVQAGAGWRAAAVAGALLLVAAGLLAAWRGPRWPVMSARFDRPGRPATHPATADEAGSAPRPAAPRAAGQVPAAGPPDGTMPRHPDGDAATLWEALDRGMDLTDIAAGPGAMAETDAKAGPDAKAEPGAGAGPDAPRFRP